jgi:cell division protein FtsW (lipid II flippase)
LRFLYLTPAQIQSRLLVIAAGFVVVLGLGLTISPAARGQTWDVAYRLNHWIGAAIWLVMIILAHWQVKKYLPDADPYLLPVASLLTGWGMLSIWRLTNQFGLRQALWILVCFAVLLAGLRRGEILEFLRKYKYIWLTGGLLLTTLTFLFGTNPAGYGPRLWLGCCGVYLQPSEPLKLLLVVYLAAYFAGRMPISGRILPLLLPTLLLTGIALAILVIQRDLGTASLFVFLYAAMVFHASAKRRILFVSSLIMFGLGLAGYFSIEIIQYRLVSWFNPWLDPSGRSYQIIQSLLAVANGGFFGRGIGMGSPGVVPVAHSDFIFSAITEETGLMGSLALFALIGVLVTRCYAIALRAESHFERLLAAGLGAYLGAQSILIIGGNLRLLPLTGVTLPFVSYGGSSLLTSFLALLLLLQISNGKEHNPAPLVRPAPYLLMPALFSAGLLSLALISGWWALVRADDLLARYDNPRRTIADLYVPRGSLLDRRNIPLSYSERNDRGFYQRVYSYSELSSVIGYTHGVYGQAGLEAQLDPYLRGESGYPARQVWLQRLLTGYPPPGLDVRLSIDLSLQEKADQLLGSGKGAVVLLNSQTGEILAMASHPTFDANLLDTIGADLLSAPDAPLLNRASQGMYPAGTSLAPFLLAEIYDTGRGLPAFPPALMIERNERQIRCTLRSEQPPDWDNALPAGCPRPILAMAEVLEDRVAGLLKKLGLQYGSEDIDSLALGQTARATPLTMALAAAALGNDGLIPAPQLPLAVNIPGTGWVILAAQGESRLAFSAQAANEAALRLRAGERPYWESMGRFESRANPLIWYLGGTLPDWPGTPLAIAVVLEADDPPWAQKIGRGLLEFAIGP